MLGFVPVSGSAVSSIGLDVPTPTITGLGAATYTWTADDLGVVRNLLGQLGVSSYALTASDLAVLNAFIGQLGPSAYTLTASDLAAARILLASLGIATFDVTASDLATEEITEPLPIRIGDLADADKYSPTWQLLMGRPKQLLLAGQNTVAIDPPPNDAYILTLDVVRNAPVPTSDSDVLQIGADLYDAILDMAQHLALFKEGPGQLEQSMALLNRFAAFTGIALDIQQASQPSRRPLLQQQHVDEQSTARELPLAQVE